MKAAIIGLHVYARIMLPDTVYIILSHLCRPGHLKTDPQLTGLAVADTLHLVGERKSCKEQQIFLKFCF